MRQVSPVFARRTTSTEKTRRMRSDRSERSTARGETQAAAVSTSRVRARAAGEAHGLRYVDAARVVGRQRVCLGDGLETVHLLRVAREAQYAALAPRSR